MPLAFGTMDGKLIDRIRGSMRTARCTGCAAGFPATEILAAATR
ncbi:hypothetical protein GCM10017567_25820 [Amycolatopsis bullii]|uniref:Uncharacterized protein n=1 Tax=Amycolatopsis bullii TaxID=941987 RepID=A0ABQ3K8F2_9PSEU|nr:hypothetical protein GCM10017567_25820 [Amycolatopsis bullii]